MIRRTLIFAGILLTALWLWQLHPYLNVANDAGRYMILGKSLATTGDYRLINEPLRQRDTLYPPGFPLLIAAVLKLSGREPGGIVLLVKATQLVFLLLSLPLIARLLQKANCRPITVSAAVLIAACCPAYASYANEIMAEAPFLLLCLVSVVLVERTLSKSPETQNEQDESPSEKLNLPPNWARILSLLFATLAFLVRSAGVSLLIVQCVWFWRRFGVKWGIAATVVSLCVVGGWQSRNRNVVKNAPPGVLYSSYADQFTLRDPMRPGAGRIQKNWKGLAVRAKDGFPVYSGMTPRTLLHSMSRFSAWGIVFYVLAIPLGVLMFAGVVVTWKHELRLSAGFGSVFWLFAAMWPWRDPRFLVPILPFLILYAVVTLETLDNFLANKPLRKLYRVLVGMYAALLFSYFLQVHLTVGRADKRPIAEGYSFGRSKEEGGFYAACEWLKANTSANVRVMGRPAYLLSLYSDRTVTQIEPHPNPKVQEKAYLSKNKIDYLVADTWTWAKTDRYVTPYLAVYGKNWRLVWEDKRSGVKIWQRIAPYEITP